MWRSPLLKGILGDHPLDHMIASSVPSSRDLCRSETYKTKHTFSCWTSHRNIQELTSHDNNVRKTSLSDVPPPDQDVNILGDVWSILVLVNYSVALDLRHLESVLYFHPCFVIFRYLWWFVTWSWRHGLRKRYDPAQQTTTIRRHTKFQVWPQHEEGDSFRLLSIHLYNRTDSGRTHRWNVHTDRGEVSTNCRILVFSQICDTCALLRLVSRLVSHEKGGPGLRFFYTVTISWIHLFLL